MKTLKSSFKRTMGCGLFLTAVALLLSATPSQAASWGSTDASFFSAWGFSDDWAVLEYGNQSVSIQNQSLVFGTNALTLQGNGDTADANQLAGGGSNLAGGAGDIGIAGAPGQTVSLQIKTQSRVGNVILNNGPGHGTINVSNDNNIGIHSTTSRDLNNDITAANNMSSTLALMPKTTTTAGWSTSGSLTQAGLIGGTLNLGGNATLTDSTMTPLVFNLSTFNLAGSVLTLSGSVSDEIIFNITGGKMSVNNHAGIVLTGGLTPADVIYNNIGPGTGPVIDNHSYVSGIVVASQQSVTVDNQSIVFGAVISNGLNLNNHSTIESPDN